LIALRRLRFPLVLVCLVAGCRAGPPNPGELLLHAPAWHFSDVAEVGDARRRASNRLVGQALSESNADTLRAGERIRRALQVDPTNPWAYLALAREQVARGEYEAAWAALDQAEARMLAEGEIPLGVRAHLSGLRGRVLVSRDRSQAAFPLFAEAERLAPAVWDDQHLNAAELR
jgi:tetratricopeptide (TPR) repeat protein